MNQKREATFDRAVFGEVIDSYTRAEALGDGVLIDVTATAKEAGFRHAVAITAAVWSHCVRIPLGLEGQSESGRIFDILWMLQNRIRREVKDTTEVSFQMYVRTANNRAPELVTLKAICGPDDDCQPCLTILLPHED
jgi:hypothetical protein